MFVKQYCTPRARAEAALPAGTEPRWSQRPWYYDCGVSAPTTHLSTNAVFAGPGITLVDRVDTAVAAALLASVVSFPPQHGALTVDGYYAAADAPGSSVHRFTTTAYKRASVTVGYYALVSDGGESFAVKLRLFVASRGYPLLVVQPLRIVTRPHGYVTVGTVEQLPLLALPWQAGLRVTQCATTEHSPGTLALMPVGCLPVFLFDRGHAIRVASNHTAGTVPVPVPS
jgi:hypothetical protein